MHHQQHGLSNRANRMPVLLAINRTIFAKDKIRISKHSRCRLKIHAGVLLLVCPVFLRIPFEEHSVIQNV